MLKLISGAFHPDLERAFLDRIHRFKKDPFPPLLIVAPTGPLMDQLQRLLTGQGRSYLNLHFHTFSSMAQSIVNEEGGLPKTVLSDPSFWNVMVKWIIKEDRPFPGLSGLAVPEGFPPQVRSTLRDMVDAGIPPDGPVLLEAVKEDFLGKNVDVGWLLQLLQLYRLYSSKVKDLKEVSPWSDLLKSAIEQSPGSTFLKKFNALLFYGFSDMTGLQKDLFEAIVKNYSSQLYFPYIPNHPAYGFSGRFRESVLLGLADEIIDLETSAPLKYHTTSPKVEIMNSSGLKDEAWWIAGQIRKIHDQEKIPFHRMAVISRNKERFENIYLDAFWDRLIPFKTSAKQKFSKLPLLRVVLDALNLEERASFADKGSWSDFVGLTMVWLQGRMAAETEEGKDILSLMKDELQKMSLYDWIKSPISKKEFLEALEERWLAMETKIPGQSSMGVRLLHAEAARGLSFDVVILAGLEERVFPRVIREDPFLRDDARIQLNLTLGYKINPKMAGLEEEKQLFQMILSSAQKKLILTYQRTDENGSVVGPSHLLRAFMSDANMDPDQSIYSLPRPYKGKILDSSPESLPPKDLMARWLWAHQEKNVVAFLNHEGKDPRPLKRGLEVLSQLESFDPPGARDGCVNPKTLEEIFKTSSMSATGLETFGRCPFQYFATKILDLVSEEEPDQGLRIPPDKKGNLVHTFLENFYRGLKKSTSEFPEAYFNQGFEKSIGAVSAESLKIYPLYWKVFQRQLKEDLKKFVREDLADLKEKKSWPLFIEEPLKMDLGSPLDAFHWFGKPDRIDQGEGVIRIQDYKTGHIPHRPLLSSLQGLKIQPSLYILLTEKFLASKGIPVSSISFTYRKLGKDAKTTELTYEEWCAHKDQILETLKTQLDLLKGGQFLIHPDGGLYDQYCQWCDVQQICRKNHGPSLNRSQKGAGVALKSLRSKKPQRI